MVEEVEHDRNVDPVGQEQELVESSPLVVLDDESRACTVAQLGEACFEPLDRSHVDDDLVRGIGAERVEEPIVVLELGNRGLHDLRPRRREHRVLPRMGREARS